jgi:hypothetical protein
VDRKESIHGLDLDDDEILHDQVDPIARVERHPLVDDGRHVVRSSERRTK